MNVKLFDIDPEVRSKLPSEGFTDNSGIGVHYIGAYIKPMNTTVEDGVKVACKRKDLKIILTVGEKTGAGLMRRIDISPNPVVMLQAALTEAAQEAGSILLP